MLSYHGRSHYNSVVNPKHPPPLQPLGTSYIRQGRILREQQAKAKAKVAKASGLVKSQASGEGALADMLTPTAEMKQKKKNKRANRLAFFRFRKNKKSLDGGGDEVSAANQTSESRVAHKKRPAMLQPLGSEPDMNKLMSESSTALHNDSDGGNSQSVLQARQERQRPSLPSLQTGTGEEAAMQRANQVLRAAQFHEEHLQSQGL